MIGFVEKAIRDLVVAPQSGGTTDPDLVLYLDPDSRPLDVSPQEADLLSVTSRPIEWEIGGGVTFRHEVSLGITVQHGVPAEGRRRLDGIVSDLVLRALDAWEELAQLVGPRGEYPARLDLSVDWRGLPGLPLDTPIASAVILFLIDVQLDR